MLPDGSGIEVCEDVRRWSSLPIVVLSAVGDEREKVRALDAGADDYVTKPFGAGELTARIRAVLRRSSDATVEPGVAIGAVAIDRAARRVTRAGDVVHLTPIEYGSRYPDDLPPSRQPESRHIPVKRSESPGPRVGARRNQCVRHSVVRTR